jgi:hypothetical protein
MACGMLGGSRARSALHPNQLRRNQKGSVPAPHRESEPGESCEVAAGEPVAGATIEEDHALDWSVNDQPGRRRHGQSDGPEQAGLDADPGEEDQGDKHDDRGEQAELDEQLRGQSLLRGRCAGGCPCPYRRLRRRGGGCPAAIPEIARFVAPNG